MSDQQSTARDDSGAWNGVSAGSGRPGAPAPGSARRALGALGARAAAVALLALGPIPTVAAQPAPLPAPSVEAAAAPAPGAVPHAGTHAVPSAGPRAGRAPARRRDEAADLSSRFRRWQNSDADWSGPPRLIAERYVERIDELVQEAPSEPSTWQVVAQAATFGSDRGIATQSAPLRSIGDAARRHVARMLRGHDGTEGFEAWALSQVVAALPDDDRRDFPNLVDRRVMLRLLETERREALRVPLLALARRPSDPLRPDVLRTLARWSSRFGPNDAIDLFLVDLLGKPFDKAARPHPFSVVLERVSSSDRPLSARARQRLEERVEAMLISSSWRDAARAIRLTAGYPVEERIPLLLDALTVWHTRSELERGQVAGLARIQGDIVRALQGASDQFHGPYPKPWIEWWVRVRKGEAPMPGTPEFEAARERRLSEPESTAGGFFGVQPETDRVTFIIDKSGSMDSGFGTTGNTRYVEAVEQMMRFLQGAPEGTRFNVILFASDVVVSSDVLVEATPDKLEAARRSLLRIEPEGGTNLRPAVQRALHLGRDGFPDLDAVEADTIVVLCDGATAGGAAWVPGMLDRVLPVHPVVIHSVLIGSSGNGALQALAEGSGGEFVAVGG